MGLGKNLKLRDVVALAAGAMISSGLFVLPGIAFALVGPAVILGYFTACVLIVPAMLVQAELATAMPKAGGTYVFIERSLGPLAGTFAGFLNWISIALKSAFALIGLGAIIQQVFPEIGPEGVKYVAVAGCVLFTVVNLVSVESTGKMQVFLVIVLVAILGLFVGQGGTKIEGSRLFPFFVSDVQSIIAVSGLVFVSFGGLTKVASLGEEVVDPAKNLPLGMFLAWLLVSMLYLLAVLVTVGTVEADQLSGSLVPIGLSAKQVLGPLGMILVDLAAAIAFITTANAGILAASRTPLAMSRDGLLPEFLSYTNSRFKTPHTAIILTSLSMISVIAFLSIEDLVKTASTMMILLFLTLNLALVTLRLSKIQSYQPPFRMPMAPALPLIASVVYAFLIIEMGVVPISITAGFGVVAGLYYVLYVSKRIERESAFVHLVKSVTSKPLQRINLEDELRQISLERVAPEVTEFYQLLGSCPVIEIENEVEAIEMYHTLADNLAQRVGLTADNLFELFIQREYESSTVVHAQVSIPVIVVDEPDINEFILVRAREGVVFSKLHAPVHAIFVFVGSFDKRNFHLRALMRLAHIIEQQDFLKRWSAALDEHQLRDVLVVQAGSSLVTSGRFPQKS